MYFSVLDMEKEKKQTLVCLIKINIIRHFVPEFDLT